MLIFTSLVVGAEKHIFLALINIGQIFHSIYLIFILFIIYIIFTYLLYYLILYYLLYYLLLFIYYII